MSDSKSRDARINTGRNALAAATGYGYNLGVRRNVRIGSARDDSVKSFIPDPCPYPYAFLSTMGAYPDLRNRALVGKINRLLRF